MGTEFLGPLCAFLASITWALGSTTYSRLARTQSPFAINFFRALVALPLFFVTTFVLTGGWSAGWAAYAQLRSSNLLWFLVAIIASYGLADVIFMLSTRSLGIPGALAIASAYPLWTALAGFWVQGQGMSTLQGVGLVLTIAGVVVVILSAPQLPMTTGAAPRSRWMSRPMGVFLAVLTSGMWALNGLAVARGAEGVISPVANTVRMVFALAMSAGLGRVFMPQASILLPFAQVSNIIWIIVIEAFLGSIFYMYGFTHSTLVIASTLSSLAPVLSVPVAWLLKLEKVSLWRTLGIILVISGLWLLLGVFDGTP